MSTKTSRPPSILLLSGGLDSAVCLGLARKRTDILLCLYFDYGQRSAAREQEASIALSRWAGAPIQVIRLPWLAEVSRSGLTNPAAVLPHPKEGHLDDPVQAEKSAKAVWVPNRNGVFVHIAAALAEAMGATQIVAGFNKEEAQTFPDNSAAFVSAVNRTLQFSTLSHVKLVSFTQKWDKVKIARQALRLGIPLHLLWSCYEGGKEACGACESCQRSQRAFLLARET